MTFGLVTMAIYFGHSMMLKAQSAANQEGAAQAEQAVEGAARYVEYLLANLETPGTLPDPSTYAREAVPVGHSLFWLVGRDTGETGSLTIPWFDLIDEAGKLNLNTATVEMLELLPGMDASLAAAIVDWRDEDDEASENGAELETYSRLKPPYNSKNAPFETAGELRLVYGFTEEILLGEDANRNGILDPNENDGALTPPVDDEDGSLDLGLLEYVTVYSAEPNTQTNGEPRIDITGNLGNNLRELLTETFGDDRGGEINLSVQAGGGNMNSLVDFYLRSGMTRTEFAQIDDRLSMSTNSVVEGLVNVNTASAAVLNCLPGLDTGDAEKLVAWRRSNSESLDSVAWVTEALDEEAKARRIGPFITDKSFQFTADISAVGRNGRGHHRSLYVFDLSEGSPRIAYRREMSREGWALGQDVRTQIAALRKGLQP